MKQERSCYVVPPTDYDNLYDNLCDCVVAALQPDKEHKFVHRQADKDGGVLSVTAAVSCDWQTVYMPSGNEQYSLTNPKVKVKQVKLVKDGHVYTDHTDSDMELVRQSLICDLTEFLADSYQ